MTEQESQRFREMEVKMAAMEPKLNRLDEEIFNHEGVKGVKTIVLEHIATTKNRDDEIEKKLEATALLLNGPSGKPESGFVYQVLAYLEEAKKRSWTRSQKIGVAAWAVPLTLGVLWFCAANVYTFVKKVDDAIQVINEIHQTRDIHQNKSNPQGPVGETQNAHNQQDAIFQKLQSAR